MRTSHFVIRILLIGIAFNLVSINFLDGARGQQIASRNPSSANTSPKTKERQPTDPKTPVPGRSSKTSKTIKTYPVAPPKSAARRSVKNQSNQTPANQYHRYYLRGRVVEENGRAVPDALVYLDPAKTAHQIFALSVDPNGAFQTEVTTTTPRPIRRLYVTGPIPAGAVELASPPYSELSNLVDPAFAGQQVLMKENGEVDLRDVRIQRRYQRVTLHLVDDNQQPVLTSEEKWDDFWLRLRDASGTVIESQSLSNKDVDTAVNFKTSSIVVAVPEGTWFIDASLNGQHGRWFSPLSSITVSVSDKPIDLFLNVSQDQTTKLAVGESVPATVFYTESWKTGHTKIQPQTISITLNSHSAEYERVIKNALGQPAYKLSIWPGYADGKPLGIIEWMVEVTGLKEHRSITVLKPTNDPGQDYFTYRDRLGWLYPLENPQTKGAASAVVPFLAKRIVKIEDFYCIIEVKSYQRSVANQEILNSITLSVEFTNTNSAQLKPANLNARKND